MSKTELGKSVEKAADRVLKATGLLGVAGFIISQMKPAEPTWWDFIMDAEVSSISWLDNSLKLFMFFGPLVCLVLLVTLFGVLLWQTLSELFTDLDWFETGWEKAAVFLFLVVLFLCAVGTLLFVVQSFTF